MLLLNIHDIYILGGNKPTPHVTHMYPPPHMTHLYPPPYMTHVSSSSYVLLPPYYEVISPLLNQHINQSPTPTHSARSQTHPTRPERVPQPAFNLNVVQPQCWPGVEPMNV
jgi:hypothetical protein